MSTFAVKDGKFYADTLCTRVNVIGSFYIQSKICKSPDNQFVFALSGMEPTPADEEVLTEQVRILLEHFTIHTPDRIQKREQNLPQNKKLREALDKIEEKGAAAMLMASGKTLISWHGNMFNQSIYNHSPTGIAVCGGAAFYMLGLLIGGTDPKDAYRMINVFDQTTGSTAEVFDLSTLDDFVVKG